MNDTPRDRDDAVLREAYEALRADQAKTVDVPDFQAMMARAREETAVAELGATPVAGELLPDGSTADPSTDDKFVDLAPRRRARALTGWLSLATAATAAALIWTNLPSAGDREFERLVAAYSENVSSGTFGSPTDGLLRTPGLDLGAVPSFSGALRGFNTNTQANAPEDGGRDS